VGNVSFKLNYSQHLSTVHIHWLRSLPPGASQWKDFSANYCHCLVENISQMGLRCSVIWDTALSDTALRDSSRYASTASKQPNLFCRTHWYQHINFNITVRTSPAAVSTVMLQACCSDRLNSFSILTVLAARYASCRNQQTSEKYWLMAFLFQTKKCNFIIS
jgi:hypothetical protein